MSDENDNRLPTVDDCILWLDRKYARHNELEDKYAADHLRTLRLQLSRAKQLLNGVMCHDCLNTGSYHGADGEQEQCRWCWERTEFLKEVGESDD